MATKQQLLPHGLRTAELIKTWLKGPPKVSKWKIVIMSQPCCCLAVQTIRANFAANVRLRRYDCHRASWFRTDVLRQPYENERFFSQYDNHTTASIVKWNRLKTLHRYLKFKHISNCLKVCSDSTSAIYESRVVPPWEIISVLTAEVYHGSGSYYITAYSHCKT